MKITPSNSTHIPPYLRKPQLIIQLSIMQQWKEYQEKNKDRFLEELLELLRIQVLVPEVSIKMI
jgi:hypothetical protein